MAMKRPVMTMAVSRNHPYLIAQRRREQEIKQVQFDATFFLTTYVSLLDDIAISCIDEIFEKYIDAKMFAKDGAFKSNLTSCHAMANETYDKLTENIKDKAFYADLCDAGQDYIRPYLDEMYSFFSEAYKKAKVKCYKFGAQLAVAHTFMCASQFRIRDILSMVRQQRIEIEGTKVYDMTPIDNILMSIMDKYIKNFSEEYEQQMDDLFARLALALQPECIVKEACAKALECHPERTLEIQSHTSRIFGIKWK